MERRRFLMVVIAVALALIAAACGSSADSVDVMAEPAPEEAASDAGSDDPEPASETGDEPEPEATAGDDADAATDEPTDTEAEATPVVLPSGRDAIAAAEGQAYALWFWGAH